MDRVDLSSVHDALLSGEANSLTVLGKSLRTQMTQDLLNTKKKGMEAVIKKLDDSDYWVCPASAKYHSAHKYGLIIHSFVMGELIQSMSDNVSQESAHVVAYLHDLCKIGNYKKDKRWRKDARNKWESYPGYTYNEDKFPVGHGEKSLILLLHAGLELTTGEMLAIRHHMGLGDTFESKQIFANAASKTGLVTITHAADILASFNYELQGVQEELVDI